MIERAKAEAVILEIDLRCGEFRSEQIVALKAVILGMADRLDNLKLCFDRVLAAQERAEMELARRVRPGSLAEKVDVRPKHNINTYPSWADEL